MASFPLLSERHTAGICGLLWMPQASYIGPSGYCNCFSPDWAVDKLVDLWCGENNEHCARFAASMAMMPTGQRWGQLGGWFGNVKAEDDNTEYRTAHRAATVEAFRRYMTACEAMDATPNGLWVDDENGEWADNARDLNAIIYESGACDPRQTRTVAWNIYDGLGERRNIWGAQTKVPGVIDRRTSIVMGYLDLREPIPVDQQVSQIVGQAIGAKNAGYDFVPLVTGALCYQDRVPYPPAFRDAYQRMARELANLDPVAVIVSPTGGQGEPPLTDPGVKYDQPPINRKDLIPGNWPQIMAETIATVAAWRDRVAIKSYEDS